MPETQEVIVARIEQRLIAVERDVRDIKGQRPSWAVVMSSVAATAALVITLIQII